MALIAVIEDDVILREHITEYLEEAGHEIVLAENGLEGIELIRQTLPDIVVCDIMMPKLGGFGVLEYIRKDPATEIIPFIFLSALSDRTDLRKGMLSGADDYLTKPFSREDLITAVDVRLQKQNSFETRMHSSMDDLRESLNRSLPHELLTPLNSIIGLSHLLEQHIADFEQDEVLKMLGNIHQSGERLLRLVQNYLRFAELEGLRNDEQRRMELFEERVLQPDVVITDTFTYIARRMGRERDLFLDVKRSPVRMSISNFQKVIEELADNACKFSLDGTKIEVQAWPDEGAYRVEVTDHGRGMTDMQIRELGAYRQFERDRYEQRGVGLGFAIVNTIVELHEGAMDIDSEPGKFTRVRLTLPLVEEDTEPEAA